MAVYMNEYFEHSQDISAKVYKLEVEILKNKINKAKVKTMKVKKKVDDVTKRVEDAEATLQRTIEKNSRIKDI